MRKVLAQLPFGLVLVIAAVGFVFIALYHWRQGSALVGGALLVAAFLRAVLGSERAGLLAIRSKPVDILLYTAFGILMLAVDITIIGGPLDS